jgi:hypothetical protein
VAAARIVWGGVSPTRLAAKIARLPAAMNRELAQVGQAAALEGEAVAKAEAPWQNRTGAARAGLHGSSSAQGMSLEVVQAHGVDYGVWLELANQGRYAIIPTAMAATAQSLERGLDGLLERAARTVG